ncbi:MAG: hypothetical protein AABW56_01090, partial [Nanoarchaeota archaeon]
MITSKGNLLVFLVFIGLIAISHFLIGDISFTSYTISSVNDSVSSLVQEKEIEEENKISGNAVQDIDSVLGYIREIQDEIVNDIGNGGSSRGSSVDIITGLPVLGDTIIASIVVSKISGVAPLAVFFDATGTTHSDISIRPFHDLYYEWSFGDVGSG